MYEYEYNRYSREIQSNVNAIRTECYSRTSNVTKHDKLNNIDRPV